MIYKKPLISNMNQPNSMPIYIAHGAICENGSGNVMMCRSLGSAAGSRGDYTNPSVAMCNAGTAVSFNCNSGTNTYAVDQCLTGGSTTTYLYCNVTGGATTNYING